MTEVEKSNNDSFALSTNINIINSGLPLNEMTINRSKDIAIREQMELNPISITEEESFVQPRSTIDKAERHENYSIKEDNSPLEKQLNINISELTIKTPSVDISHSSTLPSSLPSNIDKIKSNEILVDLSRSIKSITSLGNTKRKSSTDIRKSSLSLRTARSTLDFGLMIDEIITENF